MALIKILFWHLHSFLAPSLTSQPCTWDRNRADWRSRDRHQWVPSCTKASEGSCGFWRGQVGAVVRSCWLRTIVRAQEALRSQSAQECGRGSCGNNVQRSYAFLGPTRSQQKFCFHAQENRKSLGPGLGVSCWRERERLSAVLIILLSHL